MTTTPIEYNSMSCAACLDKYATVELKEHQQRVIDKLYTENAPHGIVAYHSLGSGKTLTALSAAEKALSLNPTAKILFVVPASLVDNVYKEMAKHGTDNLGKHIEVVSYEKACRDVDRLCNNIYDLTVFDEAHRLRNVATERVRKLQHLANSSHKLLLLTGTMGYNHPSDVTSLINIINPDEKLPNNHVDFEKTFINNGEWRLKNKDRLREAMQRYVDRYQVPADSKDFPTVERRIVPVEMTPKQADMYRVIERNIPSEIRYKLRDNLPMTMSEANNLNLYSQGIRQVSNSPTHHNVKARYTDSPKIMLASQHMLDAAKATPGFRGVMYSNYLDAGITPYTQALEAGGIHPLVFTGGLSASKKKALVEAYNSKSKKPQVLLLSSSGGEGLDLKNTQLMQVLEPHFNISKIRQAEGRAVRYHSHESLPRDKQHVVIEEYRAYLPKTTFQNVFGLNSNTAIDDYLAGLSEKKQGIVDEIDNLV